MSAILLIVSDRICLFVCLFAGLLLSPILHSISPKVWFAIPAKGPARDLLVERLAFYTIMGLLVSSMFWNLGTAHGAADAEFQLPDYGYDYDFDYDYYIFW